MKILASILVVLAILAAAPQARAQTTVSQGGTGLGTVPPGYFLTGSTALRLAIKQFIDLATDITGVLGVTHGGTGTSTSPTLGKVLVGNSVGGYDLVASSTFGGSGSNYFTLTGNNLQNNVGTGLGINIAPNFANIEVQASTTSANPLAIWTSSGSPVITAIGSGNVGIGTSTPLLKLEVVANTAADYGGFRVTQASPTGVAAFLLQNSAAVGDNSFFCGSPSQTIRNFETLGTGARCDLLSHGYLSTAFGAFDNVPVVLTNNNLPRLTVAAGGNIGIGTTTPTQLLTLGGLATQATTVNNQLLINSNGRASQVFNSDWTNAAGEPGGAYSQYMQDGGLLKGLIGTTQTTGLDPAGENLIGAVGNDFVISASSTMNLDLAANGSVGAILQGANVCNNLTHFYIGSTTANVGGDQCPALMIDQQDTNSNVIMRLGGANAPWAGEFLASPTQVAFGTKSSVPLGFSVNGNRVVTIDTTLNTGFGSTTPWGKLSASSTSAFPTLAIKQLGAGPSAIFEGGNVGVGTTSPWRKFSVTGTVGFDGLTAGSGTSLCLSASLEVVTCTVSSSVFPFTPATNFAVNTNSTSTPIWFQSGLYASSTAVFANGVTLAGNAAPAYAQGKLVYDTDNQSLTFSNNDSNVSLQVGQEEWTRVINNTGSTIANGSAVYINGTSAGLPTIALSDATDPAKIVTLGLTTESIANGGTGYVTTIGVVHGLNTATFTAGANVYVSTTTPGGLTTLAPTSPNYRYRVGVVTVSDASAGAIHVTPTTAALGNGTVGQLLGINTLGRQTFLTVNSPLTSNGSVLALGTVPIANGGTATTTGGNTNGVEYYDGSKITNNPNFNFNGTTAGIGSTTPGSLLSVGTTNTGTNFYNNATTSKSGVGGYNITSGCYATNGACPPSGSSGTTVTPYYSSVATVVSGSLYVSVPVVSGDTVQMQGWAISEAGNCGATNNSADFVFRQSTFAATTTINNIGAHSSGAVNCTANDIYQQTATTTETWYFGMTSVVSFSTIKVMGQKMH